MIKGAVIVGAVLGGAILLAVMFGRGLIIEECGRTQKINRELKAQQAGSNGVVLGNLAEADLCMEYGINILQ